jgi:23S rRNA (cytosine1962-C5)-methyltransferase
MESMSQDFNADLHEAISEIEAGEEMKGKVVAEVQKAITGYKEINLRGMKLIKPGGFLVTSSCTSLIKPDHFLQIIDMAAKDARRKIRQVCFHTQSADHPIIWNMENTHYLKFLIVEVG